MTISNDWRHSYTQLEEFSATHPGIEIHRDRVTIPDGVRVQFYRLFDRVTECFLQQNLPGLPVDTAALVQSYNQLEGQVSELPGLKGLGISTGLDTFLHNPKRAMRKALFDPLFELLQGKLDLAAFEIVAWRNLETTLETQSRLAYPYWVSLALLRRLEPDAILQVVLDGQARPHPKPVTRLQLGFSPAHPTLRFPDFVIHSARLNQHLAFKLEVDRAIVSYTTDNRAERKLSIRNCGNTCSVLSGRSMLIYSLAGIEAIPLICDLNLQRVSPPVLVVECYDSEIGGWETVQAHSEILKPALGTFLVLFTGKTEGNDDLLDKNIHPLRVGLNAPQLDSIVNALARSPTPVQSNPPLVSGALRT